MSDVADRFWSKVRRGSACWEWTAYVNANGYGQIRVGGRRGRSVLAHRMAWELVHGDQPMLNVLHRCDNPRCVRPDHLFLGTQRDNIEDARRKGRALLCPIPPMRGEQNPRSKLTTRRVAEIRTAYARGARQVDLAKSFGVTQANISAIVRQETWRQS